MILIDDVSQVYMSQLINRYSLRTQNRGLYVNFIDLPETPSGYSWHGAEKSGSTVLFILHLVGLDSHFTSKVRKVRKCMFLTES